MESCCLFFISFDGEDAADGGTLMEGSLVLAGEKLLQIFSKAFCRWCHLWNEIGSINAHVGSTRIPTPTHQVFYKRDKDNIRSGFYKRDKDNN